MFRFPMLALLLCPASASALTFEELRADPRWACALDRARGDLLAESALPPEPARSPGAAEEARRKRLLRGAAERGDPVARAALGWWRRADAAGCR